MPAAGAVTVRCPNPANKGRARFIASHDQIQWLSRLEGDHDNLRTALDWSLSEPGRAASGVELANLVWF